jgi:tetratricopeptide (TPR) repeat protein
LATLAISLALVMTYLVIRRAAEIPFPVGAAAEDLFAAIGGVLARGLVLLLEFSAPDPFPPYRELPLLGGLAVVAGLAGLALSRGRPAVALFLSAGILMLPAASASAAIGVFGDRYYYIALAGGIAPLAGCAYAWLQTRLHGAERGMLAIRILWLLPLLAGFHTSQHAAAWTSNLELYQRAWVRSPENPHAAFHLAYELHTGQDNCEAAIPLYRLGRGVDVRAGNNLQACLLSLGHLEEAAALASELLAADPDNPGPAYNSALVAARTGDERAAEAYALEALRRRPSHRGAAMLLAELSAPRQD